MAASTTQLSLWLPPLLMPPLLMPLLLILSLIVVVQISYLGDVKEGGKDNVLDKVTGSLKRHGELHGMG